MLNERRRDNGVTKYIDEFPQYMVRCPIYSGPRTIGKDIVFDYPKQFINDNRSDNYPYVTQISDISDLIREYINCPINLLLEKHFENDLWGLTNILKAVDKRLGKEKLNEHFTTSNGVVKDIIKKRFSKVKANEK